MLTGSEVIHEWEEKFKKEIEIGLVSSGDFNIAMARRPLLYQDGKIQLHEGHVRMMFVISENVHSVFWERNKIFREWIEQKVIIPEDEIRVKEGFALNIKVPIQSENPEEEWRVLSEIFSALGRHNARKQDEVLTDDEFNAFNLEILSMLYHRSRYEINDKVSLTKSHLSHLERRVGHLDDPKVEMSALKFENHDLEKKILRSYADHKQLDLNSCLVDRYEAQMQALIGIQNESDDMLGLKEEIQSLKARISEKKNENRILNDKLSKLETLVIFEKSKTLEFQRRDLSEKRSDFDDGAENIEKSRNSFL